MWLLLVALCVLAAAALRAWGLGWGVPHAGRYYPYHPDEGVLLHALCQLNPLWGDFAPGFYNYGSLFLVLSRLVFDLLPAPSGGGSVPRYGEPFEAWVGDFARLLLVGRGLAVALGAATVLVTALLARRLYGSRAGLLAAGLITVAPLPVLLGHYLAVDVPAAGLTTLALLFGALGLPVEGAAPTRREILRWSLAAAVTAGLAAGTKYSSAPALLAALVPLAYALRRRILTPGAAIGAAGLALLLAGAAFLAATPGALLEPARFRADVLYELERNRVGQGLLFEATPPAVLYHLAISLPVALEWPLYLLALAGVAFAARRRAPGEVLLLLFLLLTLAPLALAERKFVRYVAPLIPPLVVLAAGALEQGLSSRRPRAWRAAGALAGGAALASSIAHAGLFAAPDARDQAAAFLRQVSGPRDVVALASDPWSYTPPLHPTAGCVKSSLPYGGPPVWDAPEGTPRQEPFPLDGLQVLAPRAFPQPEGALSVESLRRYRPRRVVVSDYEYEDPERLRRAQPGYEHPVLSLLDALPAEGYHLEREFRPRPRLGPFSWWHSGIPPHDWRYPMPTVRVYAR